MNSRWKQYLLYASLIIVGGSLLYILVETVKAKNTGFETKTLLDWMQLLLVPLLLAGGVFFLNRSEKETERQRAEDRAKLEREIATDRQQEAALQSYLDRMADLLLNEKLRTSENEEIRNVARTRTLTVLRGLDPTRKGIVLRFLREADLISKPIINLRGADLSGANLRGADLESVTFLLTNLQGADLRGANLENVDLRRANLQDADLRDTNLERAAISSANLQNANLQKAFILNADLLNADLRNADLTSAVLSNTDLEQAKLQEANLTNANLLGANFLDANMKNAILTGAEVNLGQLASAQSLHGAIMPDGTKHD
jgi:uncharacterized protein YjbI with pentapeptide repeats